MPDFPRGWTKIVVRAPGDSSVLVAKRQRSKPTRSRPESHDLVPLISVRMWEPFATFAWLSESPLGAGSFVCGSKDHRACGGSAVEIRGLCNVGDRDAVRRSRAREAGIRAPCRRGTGRSRTHRSLPRCSVGAGIVEFLLEVGELFVGLDQPGARLPTPASGFPSVARAGAAMSIKAGETPESGRSLWLWTCCLPVVLSTRHGRAVDPGLRRSRRHYQHQIIDRRVGIARR